MSAPTTAALLARALAARGVRFAFGMPGGDVLPLIDAMGEAGIEFVLTRHEASAGFMADAAYQLTRSPGVCVSTLGPGATNLLSGVAGAWLERSKVVAITGQVGASIRDRYTHQVLDQLALFQPVVHRSAALSAEVGFMQVMTTLGALDRERPGPVHIELSAEAARAEQPGGTERFLRRHVPQPDVPDISAAAALLAKAERPVVVVGCGELTIAAANGVRRLVEAAGAPALTTYRAKGMADEEHPLWAGPMGLSPVVDAVQQELLAQADLMIAVGLDPVELRPNWLPGWPEDLPVVSVDPFGQPDLLGRVEHALTGPVMQTLDALREAAFGEREHGVSGFTVEALAAHRARWQAPFDDGPSGPAAATRAIQKGSPFGTRLCLDVGAHRITASHVFSCFEPNQCLQSNGFSSMATGLPAAIASRLVDPERPCVCLTGDMGLAMALGELGVVQERGLDLVVVVFVDDALSLIELKQERLGLGSRGVRFENPDWVALARAFGGVGRVAEGAEALEQAVREAHEEGGLQLIEARIDAEAYRRQM